MDKISWVSFWFLSRVIFHLPLDITGPFPYELADNLLFFCEVLSFQQRLSLGDDSASKLQKRGTEMNEHHTARARRFPVRHYTGAALSALCPSVFTMEMLT